MAKFEFELGSWAQRIARDYNLAYREVIPAMKMALYEGAGIFADAQRAAASKYGLQDGVGIAKMEVSADGANTSVGFRKQGNAGYFYNRWGERVPYDLVVNVLNFGTSKRPGNHFFDHANEAVRDKAMAAMHDKYYSEIMRILGE